MPTARITVPASTYAFTNNGVPGSVVVTGEVFALSNDTDQPVLTIPDSVLDAEAVSFTSNAVTYTENAEGVPLTAGLLRAGAVCLERPTTTGGTADGSVRTVQNGIWIDLLGEAATFTYEHFLDAVSVGTGTTYTISLPADSAKSYTVAETLSGVTVSSSPAVTVDTFIGSAMDQDANALYWYAPDSVQRTGSTVTAWNDKKAGLNHLAQVGALPLPAYDVANDGLDFTGVEIIGDTAFPAANQLSPTLNTGGEVALFIVQSFDMSGQAGSSSRKYTLWFEGSSGTTAANQSAQLSFTGFTFSAPFSAQVSWANQRFAGAYNATGNKTATELLPISLITAKADQSNAERTVVGTTVTGAVTVGNLNSAIAGFHIGGVSDGTALGDGFVGKVYEVFATTDLSPANLTAITDELNLKYGL